MSHALYQRSDHEGKEAPAVEKLINMKIIEALPTIGSISLLDLSAITSMQPVTLQRLLRVAVVTGFLNQTRTGEYAHTASSIQHTSGCSALMEIFDDENFLSVGRALTREERGGFAKSMAVIDGVVMRQEGVREPRGKVLFVN